MRVAENLAKIRGEIGDQDVTLIAVSKYAELAQIEEAFANGVTEFGESKVQDALTKQKTLPPQLVENSKWHFIGHLQTNKVKQAIGSFSMIHSVDSLKLAKEISRVASERELVQDILLQVKMEQDESKSGYSPDDLRRDFQSLLDLPSVKIKGLMTITPQTQDRSVWTRCFKGLAKLRTELEQSYGVELKELSMGMSTDWRDAISCGSTMVRIGTAIFGN